MPDDIANYPKRLKEPRCVARLPRLFLVLILAPWIVGCGKHTEADKLPAESSPRAGLTALKEQTPMTGDLRVKAGVVMKSGDVKPVARTEFVLSRMSLQEAYNEASASIHPQSSEEYCKVRGYSPQLIEKLLSFDGNLEKLSDWLVHRPGSEMKDSGVPEVRTLYEKMVDAMAGKSTMADLESYEQSLRDLWRDYERDKVREVENRAMKAAQKRVLADNPVVAKTTLDGALVYRDVPAGIYYISNVDFAQIGGSKILWDYKIELSSGKENYVELANDNAWKIEQVSE